MREGEAALGSAAAQARKRLVLEVVADEDTKGLAMYHRYRGHGSHDYVCGVCGHLLAIGVSQGMFQKLVFACDCGACNKVP